MIASRANVLRCGGETFSRSLFGSPSSRSYRAAIAEIVRDVKAHNKLSNERLAELIGCEKQTVANAENECGDLNAVTLLRIAYAFGEEAIAPVRNLYLCAPAPDETIPEKRRRLLRELSALEDQ